MKVVERRLMSFDGKDRSLLRTLSARPYRSMTLEPDLQQLSICDDLFLESSTLDSHSRCRRD